MNGTGIFARSDSQDEVTIICLREMVYDPYHRLVVAGLQVVRMAPLDDL